MGDKATEDNIKEQLGWLVRDGNVSENDTVLFFFAGHGVKIVEHSASSSAILPNNAVLSNGKLIDRYINFHGDLLEKYLKRCPARQKLIVLDSCFSGEIFKQGAQPRVREPQRNDDLLKKESVIQAIASCRGFQRASSDGAGENSPFMISLLRNLQQLPSKYGGTELWTFSSPRSVQLDLGRYAGIRRAPSAGFSKGTESSAAPAPPPGSGLPGFSRIEPPPQR
ncbi:MAG: caspase family protein [Arachnia sp.]